MALRNQSAFIYGHTTDDSNNFINFGEAYLDANQRTAQMPSGSYTLGRYVELISIALNSAGNQAYDVTLDRTTRRITISAPNNFELLLDTGANSTISAYNLMGFISGVDLTGSNTYTGSVASGDIFITQAPLTNYSDFSKNKEKAEASVNTTPSGITEVVSYSVIRRMKCDIDMITNVLASNDKRAYLLNNPTGVQDADRFVDYIIDKKPLEFLPDYEGTEFVTCLLDKTGENGKGVGIEVKEKIKDKLPGYYEIKRLVFREIEAR